MMRLVRGNGRDVMMEVLLRLKEKGLGLKLRKNWREIFLIDEIG